MPQAGDRADLFAGPLERARRRWVGDDLDTVAHWLAQIAHESGQLRYVRELASGAAYEGRQDLGNTVAGDGVRFRGRGLIQLTGRANYTEYQRASGVLVLDHPELLEYPENAADVSGWFWSSRNLDRFVTHPDPVLAVTKRVNGGTNGLADRRKFYGLARTALLGPRTEQSPAIPPAAPATKEVPVIPAIIAALIPSLISALPELGKILKSENSADRNIAIATKALEVIAPAVNAANAQDAVEKITSDPAAREAAREVVRDMVELVEVGGGIPAARKFHAEMLTTGPGAARWGWGLLIAVLALLIVGGGGWVMREVLMGADFDPQTKGSIVSYFQNVGLIVAGFVFGSSVGSRRKDESR